MPWFGFELCFDDYTQSWRLLACIDTVAVAQKDRAMARCALSPKTGQWRMRITADLENRIAESDTSK
ncbi:MAG: hypothetical protein Q9P14_03200 [candidate division KSB1 bacterium]|nr:hypothetical protein [candidate division KSB1 bacterium]